MKTNWEEPEVSLLFDAYDDIVEEKLGYNLLIADLIANFGQECNVLDFGCGAGKVSRRLAKAGIRRIVGVDIAPTMISKATAHPESGHCHYHLVKNDSLPFDDNMFDAAVCCFVFINLHSKPSLSRAASEIYRTLRPGSLLYLLDTNPDSVGIKFKTFQNGDPGVTYQNGEARPVYLDIPNRNDPFQIIDNHWLKPTYIEVLTSVGFSSIEISEWTASDLPVEQRGALSDAENTYAPFIMIKARKEKL